MSWLFSITNWGTVVHTVVFWWRYRPLPSYVDDVPLSIHDGLVLVWICYPHLTAKHAQHVSRNSKKELFKVSWRPDLLLMTFLDVIDYASVFFSQLCILMHWSKTTSLRNVNRTALLETASASALSFSALSSSSKFSNKILGQRQLQRFQNHIVLVLGSSPLKSGYRIRKHSPRKATAAEAGRIGTSVNKVQHLKQTQESWRSRSASAVAQNQHRRSISWSTHPEWAHFGWQGQPDSLQDQEFFESNEQGGSGNEKWTVKGFETNYYLLTLLAHHH